MAVDVSGLVDDVRAFALQVAEQAGERMLEVKREDASWSARVTAGVALESIGDSGADTVVVTLTQDDEAGLGEMYDNGPLPAREIVPVNKQALYWEGADHPVRRVHWPGTDKHAGWWSDPLEEQWFEALNEANG